MLRSVTVYGYIGCWTDIWTYMYRVCILSRTCMSYCIMCIRAPWKGGSCQCDSPSFCTEGGPGIRRLRRRWVGWSCRPVVPRGPIGGGIRLEWGCPCRPANLVGHSRCELLYPTTTALFRFPCKCSFLEGIEFWSELEWPTLPAKRFDFGWHMLRRSVDGSFLVHVILLTLSLPPCVSLKWTEHLNGHNFYHHNNFQMKSFFR